ncbi:MAG: M28 family peptidase [Bacteroidales bacterium]|nr:M28 family peptidase [Bacteroidales bacterium]
MKKTKILLVSTLIWLAVAGVKAQPIPHAQWTLINRDQMDEIIGEASGETAYNHCIEMAGYNRDRLSNEYATTLKEGAYVVSMLKQYGIESAKIERFPNSRKQWDGIRAELWEISPGKKKLADYDDLRAMLASGSQSADVEADLVWVGDGSSKEMKDLDLKGKIVFTTSTPSRVLRAAMAKGAVGAVSMYNPRPMIDPIQIPWQGISGRGAQGAGGFAFFMPPREGQYIRDRLVRGETIRVHAVVETTTENLDLQVPTCVLPGTDPNAGEIIFSAHIFEGYTKQGANDNISGSASLLEMARMLKTMFDEGRLPRPARSIRFIWVPEFSGTIPWVQAHKDLMEKTLCNINLDMVGLWLSKSDSYFNLERTTFSNPHYVNDVLENYFRYVGETNRQSLVLSGRGGFTNRIVAPSGSDEPFTYAIERHYGSSDHEVFNDWGVGVPGVMLITWPDHYYHTSEDRPNKLDPTQFKRCCVIGAASAYTIASADDAMAKKITGEVFANANHRLEIQLASAQDMLSHATAETLAPLYKKTKNLIEATLLNEVETLETVLELDPGNKQLRDYVKGYVILIRHIAGEHQDALALEMNDLAAELGVKPVKIKLTPQEKRAMTIIPVETPLVKNEGYGGYRKHMPKLSREEMRSIYRGISNTGELQRLCNGKHNALQIKWLLDTQYTKESDIEAIINYLKVLEKAGLVTLKK